MRVFFFAGFAALSFAAAACSGGTEDTTLRRSPGAPARTQAPAGGGDDTSDEAPSSTPASTPSTPGDATSPAPSPEGGAATPAPPPAPGSCGAPKCFGLAGFGGCRATDGAGTLVTLACKDGACACLTGGQPTATFEGVVNSGEDARQLFVASCACN